jgi:RHS repeat-associated protein
MALNVPVPAGLPVNPTPAANPEYYSLTDVEVRTNAVLDELVRDYRTNALALYAYVLNHVDFRARALNANQHKSVKGALGCYLEREGNDMDLSSLTIYLLRRCGIACAYGYLPEVCLSSGDWNQLYGFDFIDPSAVGSYYMPLYTNTMVYAFISTNGTSTNWVGLVPWWKRRTLIEGMELRDCLSNNFVNANGILDAYLRKTSPVLETAVTNTSDLAMDFLPHLLDSLLTSNSPNSSLDQVGTQWRLVEQDISRWPADYDISIPWWDGVTATTTLPDALRERVTFKLVKNTSGGGILFSNVLYSAELHNRRVLVSFRPATAGDWVKVANGFYEAGTSFDMVGVLSLGATPAFTTNEFIGTTAVTVRMTDPLTLWIDGGSRQVSAGNYECYIFDFGRVTPEMLDQHYRVLRDLSASVKTNANLTWANLDVRILLGEQLCTVGLNYYMLVDRCSASVEEFTKVRRIAQNSVASFFFQVAHSGATTYLADTMVEDAFNLNEDVAYLHTAAPVISNSWRYVEPLAQERDYLALWSLSNSSLEHGILQKCIGFSDAMSSDRDMRMAVSTGGYIGTMTSSNYMSPVNSRMISNVDAAAYATIATFFSTYAGGEVWFPSKRVTNDTYRGDGWLELNSAGTSWSARYLIASGDHGGVTPSYSPPAWQSTSMSQSSANRPVSTIIAPAALITVYQNQGNVVIDYANNSQNDLSGSMITGNGGTSSDLQSLQSAVGNALWGTTINDQQQMVSPAAIFYGQSPVPNNSYFLSLGAVSTIREIDDIGYYGSTCLAGEHRSFNSTTADPVDTRTGEYYIDDTDLFVTGPKPIEFRRAYSSQYDAVGEFGYGWRFNHSCYLALGTNADVIRAVEPDGSVLCYTNMGANVWRPTTDLNPRLANQNQRGIGATANPFANRIDLQDGTNYVVTAADGQRRLYKWMVFNDGTLSRSRPYLAQWLDANSNALAYVYGQDAGSFDYGRIKEIHNQSHYVVLKYNSAGRLTEVRCDDGRLLLYDYTEAGDLAAAYRPDGSFVEYDYQTPPVQRSQSLDLNLRGDYVTVANSAPLQLTTGLTVEAWVKLDANPTAWTRFVGKGDNYHRSYGLWQGPNTNLLFQITTTGGFYNLFAPATNGIKPASGWHHIAGTWNGSIAKIYVDGQVVTSTNITGNTLITSGDPLTMGYDLANGSMVGQMDDVLVWNIARTDAQIVADMNNGAAGPTNNLVGAWSFNDGQAGDLSSNHNNGQICGAARIATDPNTYSTHLIVRETKPGGHVLVNTYDDQRRVVAQRATVGVAAGPVPNATFIYNGDGTNGFTLVKNIFNATTRYDYTNGMILKITDANGAVENNLWDNARDLIAHTDKRGVQTLYMYDGGGNIVTQQVVGDISGDGSASTATTLFSYSINSVLPLTTNLLASVTDVRGARVAYYYDNRNNVVAQETYYANGILYRRDESLRDNRGLPTSSTLAANVAAETASTAMAYDGDGNLIQCQIDPGGGQAVITRSLMRNVRGWIMRSTDATGAYNTFEHDAMGRVTQQSQYGADGVVLAMQSNQYDENGNVLVRKGSRTALDDSVTCTYDRMNRMLSSATKRYTVGWNGSGPTFDSAGGDAITRATYDGFGNLTAVTDPNGNQTAHTYDPEGRRTSSSRYQGTAALLATEQFCYDAGGLMTSNRTPRGYLEQTEYTALGKPKRHVRADGNQESWRYSLSGKVTQYTDPRGIVVQYQYDDFDRLTGRTEAADSADQRLFSFEYDHLARLTAAHDPQGYVTSTSYDRAGRALTISGPAGASPQTVIQNTYDGEGRILTSATSATAVHNTYDGLGRITHKEWWPASGAAADYFEDYSYGYTESGDCRGVGQGGQEWTRAFLDEAGRPGLKRYQDGSMITSRYDANGNLLQRSDEMNRTTSFTYDGLNRLLSSTAPDNNSVSYGYDADGNCATVVYPQGLRHLRGFDPLGRMTSERVTKQTGQVMLNNSFVYDAAGNPVTQTTARGVTINSTYDSLGQRRTVSAPALSTTIPAVNLSYSYTPNGWLQSANGGGGNVTRTMDQTGHILSEQNQAFGAMFTQSVDADGRPLTGTAGTESWGNQWNGAGRLINVAWNGANYAARYDAVGSLQTLTGAYARVDNLWALRQNLTNHSYRLRPNNNQLFGESVDSCAINLQRLTTRTWRSDVAAYCTNGFVYDSLNQLTNETNFDGTAVNTNAFCYDALNVRTNLTRLSPSGTWQRTGVQDAFSRITLETMALAGSNPVVTVSGQMRLTTSVQVFINGASCGYAVVNTNAQTWNKAGVSLANGTNVIIAIANPGTSGAMTNRSVVTVNLNARGAYAYDAEGNLLWMCRDNKNYDFSWDAFSRLAATTIRDGAGHGLNWSATYDALGRRALTTTQTISNNAAVGAPTVCAVLCHPLAPLQEVLRRTTVGGLTTNDFFLYGSDLSGSPGGLGGIGGLLATRQNGAVYQTMSDLRGNLVGFVDSNGAATFNPRYGAFGPLATPTLNAPSFSTRWRDPTGLYYFGGRYYDAAVGRFLSSDPALFFDSRNLYAYCGNDPVNGCDPDGMLEAQLRAALAPDALSVGVPPPHHNVLADGTIDDVVYAPDPAYDGRYGYVARTQGGAAACLLFLGDMLGVTRLYEAMTGRNLSTGKWMTADEQRQSQIMAGITLATWAIPVMRVEGMAARADMGVANVSARTAGIEARFALSAAAENTALVHVGERGVIRQGEFVNRVFDSRYQELGSEVSGPLGRSFTPGSGVPTTAAEATAQRGLGIYYPNNAQEAIIYRAKSDIPTINRTSLGGTAAESLIDRQYWDQLEVIRRFSLPKGTP